MANTTTTNGHSVVITHYDHRKTRFPLVGYIEINGIRKHMRWSTRGQVSMQAFNYQRGLNVRGFHLEDVCNVTAKVGSNNLMMKTSRYKETEMQQQQAPRLVERGKELSVYKGQMGGFLVKGDNNFWLPNEKGQIVMSLKDARKVAGIEYNPPEKHTKPKSEYVVNPHGYSRKK